MASAKNKLDGAKILTQGMVSHAQTPVSPHIDTIVPAKLSEETRSILIKGSALQGRLTAVFRSPRGNEKQVHLFQESENLYQTEVDLPKLFAGQWTLNLQNEGGESNLFPIEVLHPTGNQPAQETVEESPAPPMPPITTASSVVRIAKRSPSARKPGRPPSEFQVTSTKTIRLPLDLWQKLKYDSVTQNMPMTDLAVRVLYNHYKKKGA